MNELWLKPEQILQNKCMGRHHWESFGEMVEWCQTKCPVQCRYDKRYPFEDSYFVPGLGRLTKSQFDKLQTCTIAFTMVPDYDNRILINFIVMYYTSIEQSKSLIGHGLKPTTADMMWNSNETQDGWEVVKLELFSYREGYAIPCWSIGRLIELFPRERMAITLINGVYHCTCFDENGNTKMDFVSVDSLVYVCCKMMEWLLDNGYIDIKNTDL